MAHDNNVFKNTSWGRTRGPKNLTHAQGASATVTLVASGGADPSAVTDGYATENQRYLHLAYTEAGGVAPTVTVWAYSHAFGTWGKLTGLGGAVTMTATASQTKVQIFEISGVDRVYFKSSGTPHGSDKLFAACSTF